MPKKKELIYVAPSDFALIARVAEVLDARPEHPEVMMRLNRDCYEAASRADPKMSVDPDGTIWASERKIYTYLNRVCKDVE